MGEVTKPVGTGLKGHDLISIRPLSFLRSIDGQRLCPWWLITRIPPFLFLIWLARPLLRIRYG